MRKLIYSILFIISIFGVVLQAQTTCDNFTVNTVVTPSTCQSNGTVTVTLTGDATAGLFNVQYSLESVESRGFFLLPTTNNVLSGIPAGTYTVTVSAFCDSQEQYSVVKAKTNVVVGGTYQVPELSFVAAGITSTDTTMAPASRNSYAGCITGRIVMALKNGNQTTTPVFTITSAPTGVSTPQTVSVTRNSGGSLSAGYTYTLDGLYPAGDYIVEINDGCYTASRNFTLSELTDVPNPNGPASTTMNYTEIYPYLGDNQDCALIRLDGDLEVPTTANADLYQYYREGLYEIGAAPLGGEPELWTTWESSNPVLNLGSHQISEFYGSPNNNTMSVYFRVKNCPTVRERYDVYIHEPYSHTTAYTFNCDYVRYRIKPSDSYTGVFCYPITYKVVNSTSDVLIEQSGITNPGQIIDYVSLEYNTSYTVSFTDKAGTIYSVNANYNFRDVSFSATSDRKNCNTWENNYYRINLNCYPVYVDIKDSEGTTVALDTIYSSAVTSNYSPPLEYDKTYTFNFTYPGRVVNGNAYTSSYPRTVSSTLPPSLNLSIYPYDIDEGCEINKGSLRVTTGSSSIIWPAGTVFTITGPSSFITQTYTQPSTSSGSNFYLHGVVIPPGNYTLTADYGCGTPYSMTTYLPGTYDVKDFTYTTENTCGGMNIIPSGTLTYMGNEVTANFRLSDGPDGYDKDVVTNGGKLTLSAAGTYTLSVVAVDKNSTCNLMSQTIVYTAPPMELDYTKTSAYACVGETVGNITLQAINGVAPYTYELWNKDNTVRLQGPQKSSGRVVYSYGIPDSTYMVRVTDSCGNSFTQPVIVTNLETAKLIIADSNPVCYGNDINLRCLTLGETIYNWTYPDGTTHPGQTQVITGADSSKAGWYKVSVAAEHCGSPVTDSIYISVYDPINITDPGLANQTFEICPKASLTLGETVTGGSGNYTYKWEYSSNGTTWMVEPATTPTLTVTGPNSTTASFNYKYVRRTVTDAACGGFVENYLVNAVPCYIPVNPDLMNLGTGNPIKK